MVILHKLKRLTIVVLTILSSLSLNAQDIHYSQFVNSPLNVSPGLTGISHADMRFSANYKFQWYKVPVSYLTFTGSFDKKFYSANNDKGFWSGGLLFNYDKAGDSRLQLIQLGVSGSYTRKLNTNNLLTFGLMVGGAHRGFNEEQLQWDSQWDGVMFQPNLGPGEVLDQANVIYFDVGGGLNYRWQKSDRTHIDLGAGVHHFVPAKNDFLPSDNTILPMRISPYLMTSFQVFNRMDFLLNGLWQFQGEALEIVPSAYLRFHLNQKRGKEFMLDIGGIGRYSGEFDAITPALGLWYNNWHAEFSYDINLSEFQIATGRFGGPEITLQYYISTVKPLNSFKTCPIF